MNTTSPLTNEQQKQIVENASLIRTGFLSKLFDDRRDIDTECGYPKTPTMEQYSYLYDREGIAQRVVALEPEDSWTMDPLIEENDDPSDTEFEEQWKGLQDDMNLFHYLHRVDELSGVGRFGVLLLGFDDGENLDIPVAGISDQGLPITPSERKLLFLRPFDESSVEIKTREKEITNPRYNQPVMYEINFQETDHLSDPQAKGLTGGSLNANKKQVHWTRVIHVADNRRTSEVYGTPRMKPVFNRLLDIRKILSGSAEMFWKGAFPGYSFEVTPQAMEDGVELDAASVRAEFESYSNGLQRYLALSGVTAKSLAPQVADPTRHLDSQLRNIAITMSIPFRIFQGSEAAKLASSQDTDTWNKRIARRQDKYLSPMLVRPFIERLIMVGVLPTPVDGYVIKWPDLSTPSEISQAEVALKKTEALAKYVAGGLDQLMPPEVYLDMVMGLDSEEIEAVISAAMEQMAKEDAELAKVEQDMMAQGSQNAEE